MGSWKKAATARRRKRLVTGTLAIAISLLLLSGLSAWGQSKNQNASNSNVNGVSSLHRVAVQLSDTKVAAGGQFSLSFILAPADPADLTITEPTYPQALQENGGPLVRTAIAGADPVIASESRDAVEVQLSFTALRAGRFVIGSYTCQSGGVTFETDPVVIAISDPNSGTVPPEAQWIVSTSTPYPGQTVFLQLVLTNLIEPLFPARISAPAPATGVFEEVRGLGRIQTARYGDVTLYQVPVATYYLTPTGDGTVSIPAATVTVKGVDVRAPSVELQVQKLPEAVQSSGAIGSFSFSANVASQEITEGDSFDLTLRVEGTGNLSYFHFPDVSSPDLIVTSTSEKSSYVPTESGYVGYREVVYQLSPRGAGTTTVTVPQFFWIDPGTGQIRRTASRSFTLTTDPAPITAEPQDAADRQGVFSLLSVAQIRSMESTVAFKKPLNYLWLLPGPLVLLVILLLRRQRKRPGGAPFLAGILFLIAAGAQQPPFPAQALQAGIDSFQAGKVQRAVDEFRKALTASPHNAGILYNQSLCYFQAHKYGEAVYYMTTAIRFRPTDARMREALHWMERRLNLTRQIEPPWSVAPDLMLIITAVLFNLIFMLVAARMAAFSNEAKRGHEGRFVIGLAFAVILTLSSAGGLIYTIEVQRNEIGVVDGEAGNLLKIPRADATSWLVLPPGTTVSVLLDSNGFYLVRTGYGVEGWLPADDVLYNTLPVGVTE